MSPSRSHSPPARRRRSPSRSRSRSNERRPSRRSRSRSPVDSRAGRRRSRSRSASPRSGDEEKHRKRHKKHSKKAKKEEKKRHKKHKHKKTEEDAATTLPASDSTAEPEEVQEQPATSAPVDVRSFFEHLQKQEAAKEPVGTVHARGLPAPVPATAISTSDKWECSKPGCGHMNSKHAPACNKCGAMKRLTEWR